MSANIPPVSDLPYKTIVDACFDGTKGMHDFSTEVMIPLCKGLLSRSQQENAVIDTYYKMTLLLRSSLALNTLDHFQTVASLTRSLFELWLDLKILAQDTTGDAVKRYNEFPEIEKFRAAEQMVNFSAAHPQSWRTDISAQQAFLTDSGRAQRVANAKAKTRSGRLPEHWTEKNVRARACSVDQEAMYVEAYPLLSWYVHAGATGTAGMNRASLEPVFGFSHYLMQRIFLDATATCAKVTKISKLDYYDDWMRGIELTTGKLIAQVQINLLRQRQTQQTSSP
jgi:hypothetical protein